MFKNDRDKGILIYGGAFNPVHIGHLRLAIEARECLCNFLHKVDFVPTASHPQKDDSSLLPFFMRVKLIKAAIADLPDFRCNEIENRRNGPSYTLDTLKEYCSSYDKNDLYFLIGSEDFLLLPTWHRWLEIVDYCNLAVAPRGNFSHSDFVSSCKGYWPNACQDPETGNRLALEGGFCLRLENNSRIFYLSIPYLKISSSRIRELWLNNLNIDFLIPRIDIEILDSEKNQVKKSWQKKK